MEFIFDAHLDLSMNATEWNRDYRLKTNTIRKLEKGMNDLPGRELSTVSFPDLRNGNIGLCVGTLIARYVKPKILYQVGILKNKLGLTPKGN